MCAEATLRTHDDALVHMTYSGRWVFPRDLRADLADPAKRHHIDLARHYFRTNPLFETGAEQHAWLNDIVCVSARRCCADRRPHDARSTRSARFT
jgi:hypothetical protein